MLSNPRFSITRCAVLAAALFFSTSLPAAEPGDGAAKHALAGQMCPNGSFVIGFDAAGNIVCSQGCAADCQPGAAVSGAQQAEAAATPAVAAATAATAAPAATAATATPAAPTAAVSTTTSGPVISEIEPTSVLYGTRELALTVLGTGFNADSVVIFAGTTYTPSVNQDGTRLEVMLATRNLTMGRYAVTVSNGPEQKSTLKKALVVY
jgi:hypothetical protein